MTKIKCKRNEMHEILKKAVSDCYEGKMTWEEYGKLEFDIVPLDFSEFPTVKESTAKYINVAFDREDIDKNGNYMLRGFIGDNLKKWYAEKEKLNLDYVPYGFYYSGFGFNDEEMIIYTWCEGDTTLTLFNDRETYQKEREETEKWFEEN